MCSGTWRGKLTYHNRKLAVVVKDTMGVRGHMFQPMKVVLLLPVIVNGTYKITLGMKQRALSAVAVSPRRDPQDKHADTHPTFYEKLLLIKSALTHLKILLMPLLPPLPLYKTRAG